MVERVEDDAAGASEYRPTQAGWALWPVLEAVMSWGARWAFDQPRGPELDPVLLMWWIRRGTMPERVPRRRVTLRVELTDGTLRVHGPPALERDLPRWFDGSPAAGAVQAAWAKAT